MTGRAPACLAALALAATLATTARAQSIPEGQSCGGLLCDMGVLGHRSEPAPAAAPPPTPAATSSSAALFDPRPVAEAATRPAARTGAPRPRKHVVAAPARRPTPAPRETVPPREVVVAAPPPPAPAPVRAPVAARAPTRAAAARPAIPLPTEPATAMQMPAPRRPVFYFQSVDPTLQ